MKVLYITTCPFCGKESEHFITQEQANYMLMSKRERPPVQEIFPSMRPEIREQFITGICPKCWEDTFGG